ncbi:ephrin-B2-like [Lampris incognitus]|uniref:ephrin-B2-like n=1 Tax=Lampris incognitus TaxID=2546036 RepID=UPI0024B6015D|nr:ephrin-B2-like [Lampris incognitus]
MEQITCRYHCVTLLTIICSCRAVVLESIYWNSSNTKFTPGQGLVLFPQIGDKMDIVCPWVGGPSGGKEEFYRVYLVSKSQMERCTIDKTDAPLLNCDKPHRDVKFTFKFQEFSPNLWGLEFLRGKDYYITSTSTSSLQGLDNTSGGVCRTKSMRLVLRVGQSPSDPYTTLQESPTRFPPKQPKSRATDQSTEKKGMKMDSGSETGETPPGVSSGSGPGVFIGIASGCVIFVLVIVVLLVLLWRCRRRPSDPDGPRSASVSLNTLAVPKRDSVSSDNVGSDRSEVVFPLQASEGRVCRHYERVSSDYGPPVYIVQELPPQSQTNIYYKV